MGEITDFVTLYIEKSEVIEDKTKEISTTLETNIKNIIGPGKVGYDTGHLHDSIISDYTVEGNTGWVTAWYHEDYGKYWYRWKDGVDFMSEGLNETVALYR